MKCPLCLQSDTKFFHRDKKREFWRCHHCLLVFVQPDQLPSPIEEKNRYLKHQNTNEDQGYLDFLDTFIQPLKKRVKKSELGLDYGSGPNPVFADLLKKEGFQLSIYDPFFQDDKSVLLKQYDYLSCVETVEHFHHPHQEWLKMSHLVKSGGWIGIKTSILTDQVDFPTWHYKGDITHVSFYNQKTFCWIGNFFKLQVEFVDESVVFFKKEGE